MYYRMVWLLRMLVGVKWDVDWVPVGRWDDVRVPIGPLGAGRELSFL